MKKRRFLPYIVSLFLLTGCGSSGSIYSNFRDVADLLPVQTLGYDRVDGKVRLSVSSGRGTDELPTVILQGSGSSITEALEMVQDYSDWEDLFFAHIRYVVVGEQAAREGLDELMDWFERIPQTRLDVPIFLVEGGDAASLVAGSGDKHEITSVLHSLQRDAARRGFTVCYTLADVAKRLAEDDCALCSSVRSVEVGGHVPTSPEGKTALESGFALLQDGALTAFTGEDAARGLCLLLNRAGTGRVELSDGQGATPPWSSPSAGPKTWPNSPPAARRRITSSSAAGRGSWRSTPSWSRGSCWTRWTKPFQTGSRPGSAGRWRW